MARIQIGCIETGSVRWCPRQCPAKASASGSGPKQVLEGATAHR
jgi:hypothetical protein